MNDLLRKTRRAFHLLRELLKYETATCCAAVLKCWNKDYRHVWLVSEHSIADNARVAQNQDDYENHYNSLTERFDTAKGELEKIGQSILEKQAQREMMKKFITEVKAMPDIISIFDEDSWCALVDYVTINSTTDVVFTMKNGLEIRI